jgi:hypothetical protein
MSGSHFIVYGARHGAKSFFEGISDPTFFMSINRILDEGFYREYFDPRLEKTFSFLGLLEFVTDREGLDIADWIPFMKALRAQDEETAPKALYWRMVRLDERLSPDISLVLPLHPAPLMGGASTNPTGRQGKERCDHGNIVPRGQSSEYRIARLKRDAPEIAIALARGEYPSVRAAAMAAGFAKPSPPSLQLKDPAPTAQKLLAKKGQAWCLQLLEELSELCYEM